jgi:WXG100 family type VII secretion target
MNVPQRRAYGASTVADQFAVDIKGLGDIVERMAQYQNVVDSMLDEIDTTVANLHLTWNGDASQAHADAHKEWKEGAEMMRKALEQLKTAGSHAEKAYRGAVEANKSMWA